MIRFGFASDEENAISLCKTHNQFSAGFVLAGYGTKPLPGAVCDDAIHRCVTFTALYIQKAIDVLLKHECADLNHAKEAIRLQIERISSRISFFSTRIGQGIYLGGSVFYAVGEQFICLPFGGGCAYHWDESRFLQLRNTALTEADPKYIPDAIGGMTPWTAAFDEGTLTDGTQLLLTTQMPLQGLLSSVMAALAHHDPEYVAGVIYNSLEKTEMPHAVLSIIQTAEPRKEERNANQATTQTHSENPIS